jgi:hypothetical protein
MPAAIRVLDDPYFWNPGIFPDTYLFPSWAPMVGGEVKDLEQGR